MISKINKTRTHRAESDGVFVQGIDLRYSTHSSPEEERTSSASIMRPSLDRAKEVKYASLNG